MTGLTRRAAVLAISSPCFIGPPAFADIPRIFRVPNPSMEPTILEGEYFLAMPVLNSSDASRGDIVVFGHGAENRAYVKRIIGLGGDSVSFSGGRPTVNGDAATWEPQAPRDQFRTFLETLNGRSYLVELGGGFTEVRDVSETVVPDGDVYVVGDSRDRSFDSRVPVFGRVALRAVSHKATSIVRSTTPSREGHALG